MVGPSRNNEQLALLKFDRPAPEVYPHFALNNKEHLVRIRMAVPDEFPFNLNQLEIVVVHFRYDLWRPVFAEEGQLLPQVDGGGNRFLAHPACSQYGSNSTPNPSASRFTKA